MCLPGRATHVYVSVGRRTCVSPWVCRTCVYVSPWVCHTRVYVSGSKVKLEMTVSHSTWVLGTDLDALEMQQPLSHLFPPETLCFKGSS